MTAPGEPRPSAASSEAEHRRVALRVTRDALRQVRGGHPWVFDRAVERAPDDARTGDLGVLFDDRRRFVAIGLYDAESPIRLRVLHRGRPRAIDAAFWRDRLASAAERRAAVASPRTDAYRWVHGENDGLGGLVLDRYADVVVAKVYTAAWFPHLDAVLDAVEELASPSAIVLRLARRVTSDGRWRDGTVARGRLASPRVVFLEQGLTFEADVVSGQKTGWFLDQRDNRFRIRERSVGRAVLDVCCAGGGFTVNAAAGGARSVHSVDISARAIDDVARSLELNAGRPNVAACRHESTVGDARDVLASLARAGATFGLVVVDPPSFAVRAAQVERALAAYTELARLATEVLEPGGTLLQASCSSQVTPGELLSAVRSGVADAGAELSEPVLTGHAADHPVGFPQGEYLSAVLSRVEPLRGRRR